MCLYVSLLQKTSYKLLQQDCPRYTQTYHNTLFHNNIQIHSMTTNKFTFTFIFLPQQILNTMIQYVAVKGFLEFKHLRLLIN